MLALSKEANSSTTLTSNEKSAFSSGVMKLAKELTNELTKHSSLRAATNRRLTREKSSWFSSELIISSTKMIYFLLNASTCNY